MRGLGARSVVAATVCLSFAMGLVGVAGATGDTPTGSEPDTPVELPLREDLGVSNLMASEKYALYNWHPYLQGSEGYDTLVRRSDGATVRTLPRDRTLVLDVPVLIGDSLVYQRGYNDPIEIRDAGSGELQHQFTLADSVVESVLHVDPRWMLTKRETTPGHAALSVHWADGHTDTDIGTVSPGCETTRATRDAVYLDCGYNTFEVDVEASTLRQLDFGPGSSGAQLIEVTDRWLVAYLRNEADNMVDPPVEEYWFMDRATGELRPRIDMPFDSKVRDTLVLGDSLAVMYAESTEANPLLEIRLVDQTGTMSEPIAQHVPDARQLLDGTAIAALQDLSTLQGRLAILSGAGPAHLTDLPPVPELVRNVALSGDRLAAAWGSGRPGIGVHQAGAGWTALTRDWLGNTDSLDFSGDAAVVQRTSTSWKVYWPGGERTIPTGVRFDSLALSHGGDYLMHRRFNAQATDVVRTISGELVTTVPGLNPAIDGHWLWQRPDASGVMRGVDLREPAPRDPVQVQVPEGCANATITAVQKRWAMIYCGNTNHVIDLTSTVAPITLPYRPHQRLGNGFVTSREPAPSDTDPEASVLQVMSLDSSHEVRRYGPIGHSGDDMVAPDREGSPRLAYVDPTLGIRTVDLNWLPATASTLGTDNLAPVLRSSPQDQLIGSSEAVSTSMTWSFAERNLFPTMQTGVISYDVRLYRISAGSTTEWMYPETWQGTESPTVNATIPTGDGACFSARARDGAGNLSDWTDRNCVTVDGEAPTIDAVTGPPDWLAAVKPGPHTFEYQAYDDHDITYDVALQTAAPGQPAGPWVTTHTDTPDTSVAQTLIPGRYHCVRYSATDAAGNVSPWSAPRCTVLPLDDRQLTTAGRVGRTTSSSALGGTLSHLRKRGARLDMQGQTGQDVGVWIQQRPGMGKAHVVVAGKVVGSIPGSAPTVRTRFYRFDTEPFTGRVSLKATRMGRKGGLLIDAVAVNR